MRIAFPYAAAFAFVPILALAAGSESDTPPAPTETTTQCADGQIYDEESKDCVDATDDNAFNDDTRYKAVRELAYAGAYGRALDVINSAASPQDPRFLNYRGFLHRKQGNWDMAKASYEAALAVDPDYHLARSYMGQGYLAQGDQVAAQQQLSEIIARGGRDTWARWALANALAGKPAASY